MFDISEKEFDSALGEICSNSDNDVDLLGGMKHWTVHRTWFQTFVTIYFLLT